MGSFGGASSVSSLFSRIDTNNQGYIEKSDLLSALDQVSSEDNSEAVDKIFSKLDADNSGQLTEQEMVDGLGKLEAELNSQFNQSRVGRGGGHGGDQDVGFTQEELTSMIDEAGDSDPRTALMQTVVDNFDTADTDGDGLVTHSEAVAYDQSVNGTESSEVAAGMPPPPPPPPPSGSGGMDFATDSDESIVSSLEALMASQNENESDALTGDSYIMKVMAELMASYGITESATSSSISTSA